jgi:hypothetical protein
MYASIMLVLVLYGMYACMHACILPMYVCIAGQSCSFLWNECMHACMYVCINLARSYGMNVCMHVCMYASILPVLMEWMNECMHACINLAQSRTCVGCICMDRSCMFFYDECLNVCMCPSILHVLLLWMDECMIVWLYECMHACINLACTRACVEGWMYACIILAWSTAVKPLQDVCMCICMHQSCLF